MEIARQKAVSLQQQIVNLKADLQQQIDRSDQLTADLEQVKGQVEKRETQLERVTDDIGWVD